MNTFRTSQNGGGGVLKERQSFPSAKLYCWRLWDVNRHIYVYFKHKCNWLLQEQTTKTTHFSEDLSDNLSYSPGHWTVQKQTCSAWYHTPKCRFKEKASSTFASMPHQKRLEFKHHLNLQKDLNPDYLAYSHVFFGSSFQFWRGKISAIALTNFKPQTKYFRLFRHYPCFICLCIVAP